MYNQQPKAIRISVGSTSDKLSVSPEMFPGDPRPGQGKSDIILVTVPCNEMGMRFSIQMQNIMENVWIMCLYACDDTCCVSVTNWLHEIDYWPFIKTFMYSTNYNLLIHTFEGILPKGLYLPCVSIAGRALLAGYPRIEGTMFWCHGVC